MPVGLENWPFDHGVGVGAVVQQASKERLRLPRCVGGENQIITQGPCIRGTTCVYGLPTPFCTLPSLSRLCKKHSAQCHAVHIAFVLSHCGTKGRKDLYVHLRYNISSVLLVSHLNLKMWNYSYTEGHCTEGPEKIPGNRNKFLQYQTRQRGLWVTAIALRNMAERSSHRQFSVFLCECHGWSFG